ncbi:MAG: hypothetical protein LBU80_00290 [Rikenellaceae bacterium]|nr:hypothetical protein [Rikenellaceae bacterium]
MQPNQKPEAVFELVKGMSKAEKRNFKLYATRLAGNQEAKFLALFDALDALDEYDEVKVLKRCPVKKEQLPNMKAHLLRQILISIRLLSVQHNVGMQLREQIDFARIFYDKGFYKQALKILDKAKEAAIEKEEHVIALEVVEFQKTIESLHITRTLVDRSEAICRESTDLCERVSASNDLSNLSILLYGLYLKLGYTRSARDQHLVEKYFSKRIELYHRRKLSFTESISYHQAMVWYHYIRHDFPKCYKYACLWMRLYDANPQMKEEHYDNYLKGYARLLDNLYYMRSYKRFARAMEDLERQREAICSINDNARMLYLSVYYTGAMNRLFLEGRFSEGRRLIREVEEYLEDYSRHIDVHHQMMFFYKIACLCFGNDEYKNCIRYLQKIISTRDPMIRRDLQCYARILMLIASYEAGIDYNLDYQIRAVYAFLVKMNDMHEVQHEMISFLKRLNSAYTADIRAELNGLYEKLKPYESHPYERRTFYYLDILAWLESKIKGTTVAQVVRGHYEAAVGKGC